jgi:uncharacterized membrane protein
MLRRLQLQESEENLAPHVEQTVQAVARLHTEHHETANWADRLLEHLKDRIGRPAFIAILLLLVACWIAINRLGHSPALDPPPYLYLQLALSLGAFCLTTIILATQRRADRLASHREKLILQLAFVGEQKTAKVIALLEELRRDSPQVKNRPDREAEQMTESVDAHAVSNALRDATPSGPEIGEG